VWTYAPWGGVERHTLKKATTYHSLAHEGFVAIGEGGKSGECEILELLRVLCVCRTSLELRLQESVEVTVDCGQFEGQFLLLGGLFCGGGHR